MQSNIDQACIWFLRLSCYFEKPASKQTTTSFSLPLCPLQCVGLTSTIKDIANFALHYKEETILLFAEGQDMQEDNVWCKKKEKKSKTLWQDKVD